MNIETLAWLGDAALLFAAFGTSSVPFLYAFAPWHKTRMGRRFMLQAVAFAAALDTTTLFHFLDEDQLPSAELMLWTNAIIFGLIGTATISMSWKVLKYDYIPYLRKEKKGLLLMSTEPTAPVQKTFPMLSNKTYDQLKWLTTIGLPALGTLYFALAGLWDLPKANEVVGTIVAVTTFFGTILALATRSYNNSDAKYDGEIHVTETDDGLKTASLQLHNYENPADVVAQKEVTFKVTGGS